MAVHWTLIEIGAPFEARLVDLDVGSNRDPEYLRLNPDGRVPTLIVDGHPIRESTALLMLLAERHPAAGLAPALGTPERAKWFELMIYLANTLLPAMRDLFYATKDGNPEGADAVKALATRRIEGAWSKLDLSLLGEEAYLVGKQRTTADFLAIMLMRWSRNMESPATNWPNIQRYIARNSTLPSFIELNKRENLTAWP
ncbi:glutathione S-transferase family protein [Gluconacetobacter asukensis]